MSTKILKQIGLTQLAHSPCILYGTIIPQKPPIYLGLYVDDIIYFSSNSEVEKCFKTKFLEEIPWEFQGAVDHFLEIKLTNVTHPDGNISPFLNQPTFTKHCLIKPGLAGPNINYVTTPYHPGYSVDSIPCENMTMIQRSNIQS